MKRNDSAVIWWALVIAGPCLSMPSDLRKR